MTDTAEFTTAPAESNATRPRTGMAQWWRAELRPLLQRVHFYAGLFVAPFVLIAAFTGLLYTATPQLEELVHGRQLHAPIPPGARQLGLAQQIDAATAVLPGRAINEIRPPAAPGGTTRVVFEDSDLPDGYYRTVFIDPYTATVRGVLTGYGQWLPIRSWFDEMHRTLHLGKVGEVYSELAASWLWVLTLSGATIWLTRRRRTNRQSEEPRPAAVRRPRSLLSWHASIGLCISLVLLFLSATGLTWSQFAGNNVTQLRHALSWSTPSVHTALPAPPADGAATPSGPTATGTTTPTATTTPTVTPALDAQRVLAVVRAHGLDDPLALDPPTKPGQAWVAHQVKRSWPEKQDSMAVDPSAGTVIDTVRFADWPLAAKLARWGVDAHMTLLFGLPNQIAFALVAAGLLVMIGAGYRMWWRRRPLAHTAARPGFSTVVSVAALAIAIGFALPVFGASLLVFLLADAMVTRRSTI